MNRLLRYTLLLIVCLAAVWAKGQTIQDRTQYYCDNVNIAGDGTLDVTSFFTGVSWTNSTSTGSGNTVSYSVKGSSSKAFSSSTTLFNLFAGDFVLSCSYKAHYQYAIFYSRKSTISFNGTTYDTPNSGNPEGGNATDYSFSNKSIEKNGQISVGASASKNSKGTLVVGDVQFTYSYNFTLTVKAKFAQTAINIKKYDANPDGLSTEYFALYDSRVSSIRSTMRNGDLTDDSNASFVENSYLTLSAYQSAFRKYDANPDHIDDYLFAIYTESVADLRAKVLAGEITDQNRVQEIETAYIAAKNATFSSSLAVVAGEGGTASVVEPSAARYDNVSAYEHSYRVVATPTDGGLFVGWFGDAEYTQPLSDALDYIYTVTAAYQKSNAHTIYAKFSTKRTPFINGSLCTPHVDETIAANYTFTNVSNQIPEEVNTGSNFYYTIANNSPVGELLNPNHPNEIISYNAASNTITAYNAGSAQITFVQNETTTYAAASQTFTITVQKHTNAVTINGFTTLEVEMLFGKRQALTFQSTNPNPNIPFTVSPIAHESASYEENNGAPYIQSHFTAGTVQMLVVQAEDYKYASGSATIRVNVAQATEDITGCFVLEELEEKSEGTGGTGSAMTINGPASQLYFDARHTSGAVNFSITAQYSVDGNTWIDIVSLGDNVVGSNYNGTPFGPFNINDENAKYIRFVTAGSFTQYYKNVRVTRKTYLRANDLSISQSASGETLYQGDTGQGTLSVDWSIANGGALKVYCDAPETFTCTPAEFGGDNADAVTPITITYKEPDNAPRTTTATIHIYNDVYHKTVTVTGITLEKWVAENGKRYRIKTGDDYVTAGVAEPMHSGTHLAQAFVFTEKSPNTFSVKHSDDQTLYETVTTEKTNGVWYVKNNGTTVGSISDDAVKYDCSMVVTDAHWGTFIAPYPVTLPTGVTAYTLTDKRVCDKVILEKVVGSTLAANFPYIVHSATAVNEQYSDWGTATADAYTQDWLTGTFTDHQTVAGDYVLQKHESGTGFFVVGSEASDAQPTVNPSRCYIAAGNGKLPNANGIRGFILSDDDSDAVLLPCAEADATAAAPTYNLAGQRMPDRPLPRGIYVRNGRKFVVN